ncbi:MAG TPA: glycosyltransferase family 9 protein, partial [Methylophilaceae bacterium]|nr:glycosyltransferase family 9 protein [Methylophilaceae bacterium]
MQNTILNPAGKILVLTSSSTGNNVFCTPAIRFLRKHLPTTVIDVVALNALSAEVFQDNPDIDNLHIVSKPRAFDKLAANYSTVIGLNVNATRKLAGIKANLLLAPAFVEGEARAEQLLQYVAGLLQQPVSDEDRHYVIGNGMQTGASVLDQQSIADDSLLVGIHLGLGRTLLHGWKFFYKDRANDVRLWPIEKYIALAQQLVSANPKIRIVVTGTRNESFLARQLVRAVPNTINLAGKTSASDVYRLMRRLNLFIAHDCGVFHIASASDVPIVGLYGPTDPLLAG